MTLAARSDHAVLSFMGTRPVDGLLDNHRDYALQHGYAHDVVDGTHVWGPRQPTLFRYHAIYDQLLRRPAGGLLMVLDQFAVCYWPHALDAAFEAIDQLVASQAISVDLANPSMLLLRNTPAVQETMRAVVQRFGEWACYIGVDPDQPEAKLLTEFFTPHPSALPLSSGITPNIQSIWPGGMYAPHLHANVRPLVANAAPTWHWREDARWAPEPDFDFRAVLNLVEEAKAARAGDTPGFIAHGQSAEPQEAEMHLHPQARIGFVSHYTTNVAGYGRIHERNFARYCRRHGYGYHLYRTVPDFIPSGIRGSWAKAHLMRRHFGEHDFLFWIDADVLAVDQSRGIDALLEGREAIAAMDHTAWVLNSSMVGVRNTAAMRAMIDDLCAQIEALEDRSSIWANGSDQTFFARSFEQHGLATGAGIVASVTLDASPIYATKQSALVHFPAQPNDHRAATMAVWDRWSLEADAADAAPGQAR